MADRTKAQMDDIIAKQNTLEINERAFWEEYARACAAEKPVVAKAVKQPAVQAQAQPKPVPQDDVAGERPYVRYQRQSVRGRG